LPAAKKYAQSSLGRVKFQKHKRNSMHMIPGERTHSLIWKIWSTSSCMSTMNIVIALWSNWSKTRRIDPVPCASLFRRNNFSASTCPLRPSSVFTRNVSELMDEVTFSSGSPRPVPEQPRLQKRQKVTRACDGCKSKKKRCTGEQPCVPCLRMKARCTYEAQYNRGS
jgi:hypothetical protein